MLKPPPRTPRPIPWSAAGALGDCAGAAVTATVRPAANGVSLASFQLPAQTIRDWAASGGARNYGVLVWAGGGGLKLRFSQYAAAPATRPALEVIYA